MSKRPLGQDIGQTWAAYPGPKGRETHTWLSVTDVRPPDQGILEMGNTDLKPAVMNRPHDPKICPLRDCNTQALASTSDPHTVVLTECLLLRMIDHQWLQGKENAQHGFTEHRLQSRSAVLNMWVTTPLGAAYQIFTLQVITVAKSQL